MRKPRLLADGAAVYHLISRVVDRRFALGDDERRHFVRLMRKVAAFSGVRVLTHCVMSNHFHILAEVPEKGGPACQLSDAALASRVRALYGRAYAKNLALELSSARAKGLAHLAESIRAPYLARMCDLAAFAKDLKQRFTQWFNSRHARKGTLWEARFKSVLVEDHRDALLTMGAYIDLNPVRAGICSDPKDYRDCGYAAAAAGDKTAREGISRMLQAHDSAPAPAAAEASPKPSWRGASKAYRALLFGAGGERTDAAGATVRKGIPAEKVAEALAKGHALTPAEILRLRVRYFCDGLVFGTSGFVEATFRASRHLFGSNRNTGPRKLRGAEWGDLRTMRDLKSGVFGSG
jgi:REP element-mobilizing transposase RayT